MVTPKKNVKIVVLGDIGHSPRMTNHAKMLAKHKKHTVDIIGYGDSAIPETLRLEDNIYYHYLIPCPRLPFKLLNYIWKTIWTTLNLVFLLFFTRQADTVLVQNPPAIPALYACWFYCKVIRAKLVIDWHNYGHTIMALSVGENSPLVSITQKIEVAIGRRADHNFCVSGEMMRDLETRWEVRSEVLYDRPIKYDMPLNRQEKFDFLLYLSHKKGFEILGDKTNPNSTIFSQIPAGGEGVHNKENRPAFLVTSTSWTEDENFSLLLNALQDYEDHLQNGNEKKLPNLVIAITGKGPMKEYYCNDIESRKWKHITVLTPWLDIRDYRKFLGCADMGISLHTSSSGLDLPMKVVDFFGVCVPVFAYNFKALKELVVDGKNGYIFSNNQELSKLLHDWFENFPNNPTLKKKRESLVKQLRDNHPEDWDTVWNRVARPIFEH